MDETYFLQSDKGKKRKKSESAEAWPVFQRCVVLVMI